MFNNIKKYFFAHKIMSVIVIIAILYGGYIVYKKATSVAGESRYITEKVSKGEIVASVGGSGQVSVLNQIDVKAKASGDIAYIAVSNGSRVSQGTLIAKLDAKDGEKAIRDAEVNLESVKIALEKLKIQKSNENMTADLSKAYSDGFNTVSNVYLDLPSIMTELNDMFYKVNSRTDQWGIDYYEGLVNTDDRAKSALYKKKTSDAYDIARKEYDLSFDKYKSVSRTSDTTKIESMINNTYDTTLLISDAIKNASNYLDFVNDSISKSNYAIPTILATDKASLNIYTGQVNNHLISLLSIKTSIKTYKDEFSNSDLDIKSSELTVKQRENALQDAKGKLEDYYIRAPFAGTIANLIIKKTESVSAGATVTTLITDKQIAEISLNEVDVAKIKIGQKAKLTFDAIEALNISGIVTEIDSIGTVSQGVVTYNVKIAFDTEDKRVKPGMSVSTSIIIDSKKDVLVVPNSAIKSGRGASYVEMFDAPLPQPTDGQIGRISKIAPNKIPVEIGLANDSQTEIISGIKEGDEIVVRIIASTTAGATPAPSLFGGGGNRNAR